MIKLKTEKILADIDGSIGWLTFNHPQRRNAVSLEMWQGIGDALEAFQNDDRVRVVQEGNVGAPDNENKYYAPGIGVIDNVPLDASLHQDRFDLRNFLQLTPAGLAEASQTLLDLEAHARTTAPDVFGNVPDARRAS